MSTPTQAPAYLARLLSAFDQAAQDHGWSSDQGNILRAAAAKATYEESRARLSDAICTLAAEVERLRNRNAIVLAAEQAMSGAYVRLREILGAMDPPSPCDPQALFAYVEKVARERLRAAPVAVPGFSPMWFAPLDGTQVLLYMPTCSEKFAVGQWHGDFNSIVGNWGDDEGRYYTHQPVSFMALANLERIAKPPAPIIGQHRHAYVEQREDGRWTMVAPTPPTGHNQVTCITYCETEDEAEELLDYWKRGFKFAASQNATLATTPSPAQPEPTVREFANELGNAIRITIEGPTSTSENVLTPLEVAQLRDALNDHANVAQPEAPGFQATVTGEQQ